MTLPTNAREALLAEALGDLASLLDRIESLRSDIEGARQSLVEAKDALTLRAASFEGQIAAVTQTAGSRAVEHIARHTTEMARRTVEGQTRALTEAARQLFEAEVGNTLRRLTGSLQRVVERVERAWQQWLVHIATAATSSVITWAVASYLLRQ